MYEVSVSVSIVAHLGLRVEHGQTLGRLDVRAQVKHLSSLLSDQQVVTYTTRERDWGKK